MKVNVGTNNSLKVKAVRAVFAAAVPEDDSDAPLLQAPYSSIHHVLDL